MRKFIGDRKGVSPVVGVMLMLIITVILAAAVNAYTSSVAPKAATAVAQFDAKAHLNTSNITMDMLSGDTIYKDRIKVRISTDNPPQSGYVNMANVTFIQDNTTKKYLAPGGIMLINFTKNTSAYTATFTGKYINLKVHVGQPFTVTIIDKDTGNPIWTGRVVMNP